MGGTPPSPPAPPPTIEGFNFDLQQGDYWEFEWDYYENSWAQGSSPSTKRRHSRFRVTLGASVLIQGVEAFEVLVSGRNMVGTTEFAPRWRYLAISENKILGGDSTSSLETIFDAQQGNWAGGGFFVSFPSNTLIEAVSGTINNDYLTETGYVVERSSALDRCEYFPGYGTICGDESYNYTEREYFQAGIGPLGYYYRNSFEDCGGGFCSGATWEHNIGLVRSSMRGETVSYDIEVEPNNSIATATSIDWSRGLWGDLVDEDENGPSTLITINTTAESSNDTSSGAQVFAIPVLINADIWRGDNGETLTISNFPGAGQTFSEVVEDWYYFTLTETRTLKFFLDFAGDATADLDFFVVQNTAGYPLRGYGIDDNPALGRPTETISRTLDAGSYWIAVDGYATPSGRVSYTLNVDDYSNPSNSIPVDDWMTFTLNSQASLSIEGVGGPSMVLTGASGTDLLNARVGAVSSVPTQISTGLLDAGTYYLGLGATANSDSYYEISITSQ